MLNKEVILGGFVSLTFPQHIVVTMVTTVLRVATRVCERDVARRSEDERQGEREREKLERMQARKTEMMCKKCNGSKSGRGKYERKERQESEKKRAKQRNRE